MHLAIDFRTSTVTAETAPAEMSLKPSQAHESFPWETQCRSDRPEKWHALANIRSSEGPEAPPEDGLPPQKAPPEPQRCPSLEERPEHSCLLSSEGPASTRQPREDSGAEDSLALHGPPSELHWLLGAQSDLGKWRTNLVFQVNNCEYLWSIIKSKLSSKKTKILENVYPSFLSDQHGIEGIHSPPWPWTEVRNSNLQTEHQARGEWPQEVRSRGGRGRGQRGLERTELLQAGSQATCTDTKGPRSRNTWPGLTTALVPPGKAANKELKEATGSKDLDYPQEQSPGMFTVT